jgi:hypothetical protein
MIQGLYRLLFGLRTNPIGIFIYGIIAKWYIAVALAGILVVYWVFKGLESTGILDLAFTKLTDILNLSKAIAKNCTPKILNLNNVWNCLGDPGAYQQAVGESQLNDIADQLQNLSQQNSVGKSQGPLSPYGSSPK